MTAQHVGTVEWGGHVSLEEDREMAAAIDRVLVTGDFSAADLAQMRRGLDAFSAAVSVTEPVHEVIDSALALPGRRVPLRTYRPAHPQLGTLVWFHGGGYVAGSVQAIDPICRALANRTGLTVVSVDYRLAPEHPFPAALEDCLLALEHVASLSQSPVALGGDSAGGGLAAAVARQTTVTVHALVLLCPWLDATLRSPSVQKKGAAFGLTQEALQGFARMYLGDTDPADPRASPLLGEDLRGLPPVIAVTAENDPLCDEGERYVDLVNAAGGRAVVRRWAAMVHGFIGMTADLPQAEEALQWTCDQLRAELELPRRG